MTIYYDSIIRFNIANLKNIQTNSQNSIQDLNQLKDYFESKAYTKFIKRYELLNSDSLLSEKIDAVKIYYDFYIKLPVNINLVRLECSHNKIKYIPSCYTKLELLTASNNSIEFIPTFINLRKMVINDNPLKEIKILPSVIYLDISYSCLEYLEEHPKLDHLVANSTKLIELPNIRTLTTIELIETPIKRIQYFPNIDTIICSINLTNHISNKYKNDYDIKLKNNNIICITKILI